MTSIRSQSLQWVRLASEELLQPEVLDGLLLVTAAIIALILANSPARSLYETLIVLPGSIGPERRQSMLDAAAKRSSGRFWETRILSS